MEIRLLTTEEELNLYKDCWEELYSESIHSSPYLCFDWVKTTLKHFGANCGLRVGILRKNSKVIAVIPLKVIKKRVGPFNFNALNFFGDEWPLQNGAIVTNGASHQQVVEELLAHLLSTDKSLKFAILIRVPSRA